VKDGNSYGFICGEAPPFIIIAVYAGFISLIFTVLEKFGSKSPRVKRKINEVFLIRVDKEAAWRPRINTELIYKYLKVLVFGGFLVELIRVFLIKSTALMEKFFYFYDSVVVFLLLTNTVLIFFLGIYFWKRETEDVSTLDRFVPARVDNPGGG